MAIIYPWSRNNNNYYESENESDDQSDDQSDDEDYEVGETGMALAVVCQWNEKEFGRTNDSSKGIDYHWLVMEIISPDNMDTMYQRRDFFDAHSGGKVSLEVVKWECLSGLELVGYWKTFWLKLVQRKWKKVMEVRRKISNERTSVKSLIYREKHGKWPEHLLTMPTLRGMMAK